MGLAACVAASVVAASGCSVYDASIVQQGREIGDLPLPPPSDTSSDADAETLVFAFHDILLNQNDQAVNPGAWMTIGLDLDGLNSTDGQVECTAPGGTPVDDGVGGIDNVLGADLWPQVLTIPSLSTLACEIDLSHTAGHGTLLLRIEKYNGLPDDAKVIATLAPAVDGTAANIDGSTVVTWNGFNLEVGGVDAPAPAWAGDGNDRFFLNPRAFYGTGEGRVRDINAYVVDDTLVFTIPTTGEAFELLTDSRSVPIVMSQGYIIAKMDETHENVVDGVLAGRFPVVNLVDVGPSIGICEQGAFQNLYGLMGDLLAEPRTPGVDPDPTANCGAISMGVGFKASAAVWQGLAPVEQPAAIWCDTMAAPPAECP